MKTFWCIAAIVSLVTGVVCVFVEPEQASEFMLFGLAAAAHLRISVVEEQLRQEDSEE